MSTPVGNLPSKLPMIDSNEDEEIKNVLRDLEEVDHSIGSVEQSNNKNLQDLQSQLLMKEQQLLEQQLQLQMMKENTMNDAINKNNTNNVNDGSGTIKDTDKKEDESPDSLNKIDNIMSITNIIQNIKSSLYIVFLFFILSIIPIEKFVYKYISLYKIPYSDIIIKSILAGVIFFALTKL